MSTQKYRRWSEFYRPRGACLAVTGGCPYPTGWLGHPNHLQLLSYLGKWPGYDMLLDL
jgi:hypothetical protein